MFLIICAILIVLLNPRIKRILRGH